MSDLRAAITSAVGSLQAVAANLQRALETPTPAPAVPWTRDIRAELARNDDCPGSLANGWWYRRLDEIDGVTLHHTLSDSPHAFAQWYVQKDGGRPSTPYTIWISQTGEVLLCNDLSEGCWHDHCGHENTHLSVGLAGTLHVYRPAEVQLRAAARVAAWAVRNPEMGVSLEMVRGHRDYTSTICPGWAAVASGHWKARFFALLQEELG